jgi:hypothetical protein
VTNVQDPWEPFTRADAAESIGVDAYIKCIRTICHAGSGIECPLEVCSQISTVISDPPNNTLEYHAIFADILLHTSFSRNVSVSKLSEYLFRNCISAGPLDEEPPLSFALSLLKSTLAAILILMGLERNQIVSSGIIAESEMPSAVR